MRIERGLIWLVMMSACAGAHQAGRVTVPPALAKKQHDELAACWASADWPEYFPQPPYPGERFAVSRFDACWFSNQLSAMKEPALWPPEKGVEAYRFTWLRTFNHPIAVRFEREGGKETIVGVELTGTGGYAPGLDLDRRSRELTSKEWNRLVEGVDATLLWKRESPSSRIGHDGAEWILEGVRGGKYRVIVEWSPGRSAPAFVRACLDMVRASGLKLPPKDRIY